MPSCHRNERFLFEVQYRTKSIGANRLLMRVIGGAHFALFSLFIRYRADVSVRPRTSLEASFVIREFAWCYQKVLEV